MNLYSLKEKQFLYGYTNSTIYVPKLGVIIILRCYLLVREEVVRGNLFFIFGFEIVHGSRLTFISWQPTSNFLLLSCNYY